MQFKEDFMEYEHGEQNQKVIDAVWVMVELYYSEQDPYRSPVFGGAFNQLRTQLERLDRNRFSRILRESIHTEKD